MAALLRTIVAGGLAMLLCGAGCQRDADPANGTTSQDNADSNNPLLAIQDTSNVTLKGERFTVALALEGDSRVKGLGDVPEIPADRGMLFIFPRAQYLSFVMRDCLVDIDIAYLTDRGTIGKFYTMPVEPRLEGEDDATYEARLTKYPSGFPARMALELRAGTLERLGVRVGDQVEFDDLEALKRRSE